MPYVKDIRCIQYSTVVLHILKIQDVSFLYEKRLYSEVCIQYKKACCCDADMADGMLLPQGSNMGKLKMWPRIVFALYE